MASNVARPHLPKLAGAADFELWVDKFSAFLAIAGLPDVTDSNVKVEPEVNTTVRSYIVMAMPDFVIPGLRGKPECLQIWQHLLTLFRADNAARQLLLHKEMADF